MQIEEQLASVLQTAKDLEAEQLSADDYAAITKIKYGAVSILLWRGISYYVEEYRYIINIENDTYFVPEAYLESYIGEDSMQNIRSHVNSKAKITSYPGVRVVEMDSATGSVLRKLETIVSDAYQKDVLGVTDTIPELKSKLADLAEKNKLLTDQLERERNKVFALSDKVEILLQNFRYSSDDHSLSAPAYEHTIDPAQEHQYKEEIISETQSENGTTMIEINYEEDANNTVVDPTDHRAIQSTASDGSTDTSQHTETPAEKIENAKYGIFPYKNNIFEMSKHEFNFLYSRLTFQNSEDEIIDTAELLVVPLSTKVKHPDLLIWKVHGQSTETVVINTKAKYILDFEGFKVGINGRMKGADFMEYLSYIDEDPASGNHLDISTTRNGRQGHLYLDWLDMKIHVCPVTFENNEDGYADFIYCIESDGKYLACGDNSEGDIFFMDKYGKRRQIQVRWADNSLYGAILDPA